MNQCDGCRRGLKLNDRDLHVDGQGLSVMCCTRTLYGNLWQYKSENIGGNLHEAAAYISAYHPEWDIVTMSTTGRYTVVVHRIQTQKEV